MGIKTALGLLGTLIGSGGVAGMAHATPTILWKSGITCRDIGVAERAKDRAEGPGIFLKVQVDASGGGASSVGSGSQSTEKYLKLEEDFANDGAVCYK